MSQPQLSVREKAREWLEKYIERPVNGHPIFAPVEPEEFENFLKDFDQIITLAQEEKIDAIKKFPSRCRLCEKQSVNTFGECECSFEDKQYLKKSDVINILKQ